MAELTDDQKQFLLSVVDDPHSDYDDELGGWPNFYISSADELTVKFESDEEDRNKRTITEGRWTLTFVEGSHDLLIIDQTEA